MSAEQKLLDNGYAGTKYLSDYSYDDALIGVTSDRKGSEGLFLTASYFVKSDMLTVRLFR